MPKARDQNRVDMKLEVVVIPVSDIDRAKRFYESLGWRLDADFIRADGSRALQLTPPGPPTSVHLDKGSALPRFLIVNDIEAARADLIARGVEVSRCFIAVRKAVSRVRIRSCRAAVRLPRSAIPTATPGCCSRSRSACPGVSVATARRSRRRESRRRARRVAAAMASMRSSPAGTMPTGRTGTPTSLSIREQAGRPLPSANGPAGTSVVTKLALIATVEVAPEARDQVLSLLAARAPFAQG